MFFSSKGSMRQEREKKKEVRYLRYRYSNTSEFVYYITVSMKSDNEMSTPAAAFAQ